MLSYYLVNLGKKSHDTSMFKVHIDDHDDVCLKLLTAL